MTNKLAEDGTISLFVVSMGMVLVPTAFFWLVVKTGYVLYHRPDKRNVFRYLVFLISMAALGLTSVGVFFWLSFGAFWEEVPIIPFFIVHVSLLLFGGFKGLESGRKEVEMKK